MGLYMLRREVRRDNTFLLFHVQCIGSACVLTNVSVHMMQLEVSRGKAHRGFCVRRNEFNEPAPSMTLRL